MFRCGIAGFWTHGKIKLNPLIFGGTGSHSESLLMPDELPFAIEVGSSNVVAIAGLNASCDWIDKIGIARFLEHERN
jgi:selenocysteine lyase/cysteine desulfurase